jgi:hypothetical protein
MATEAASTATGIGGAAGTGQRASSTTDVVSRPTTDPRPSTSTPVRCTITDDKKM